MGRSKSKVLTNNLTSDGCVWNNRDLWMLRQEMEKGTDLDTAALILGRMPSACEKMWREMRRLDMMVNGGIDDNLRTWSKQMKEKKTTKLSLVKRKIPAISKNHFTKLTFVGSTRH